MLTKRLDGLWVDKFGFIGAVMLKWNSVNEDKNKIYTFLLQPFDMIAYIVTSNGIDNSVLVSSDMYKTLLARGIARPITDEEAAVANEDEDISETNAINSQKEIETKLQIAQKASEPASTKDPSKPIIVPVVEPVDPTEEQLALMNSVVVEPAVTVDPLTALNAEKAEAAKVAAAKAAASLVKKGK